MFELKTESMAHQKDAISKMSGLKVGMLDMDRGTGKSRTIIGVAYSKLIEGKIDRVIWYCPVSLKITVQNEILKHTSCTRADINRFPSGMNPNKINMDSFWHIVGIESMSSSNRCVVVANMLTDDRTMVVVDESSYIKTHNSIRTKRITYISEKAKYRYTMTGTPITQGVVDLYAQYKFLSPKILGYNSFYSFASNHLEYDEEMKGLIVRSHNTGWIAKKVFPYTYQIKKEECLDLPAKAFQSVHFEMSHEQRVEYNSAKVAILDRLWEEDTIKGYIIFELFSTLQQIVSGFMNIDGKPSGIKSNRPKVLLETINTIKKDEKIIIWCKYIYSLDKIVNELSSLYGRESVATYHGGLSEKERDDQVNLFKSSAKFFVSTQQSGGHGLTLNESCYTIFYENEFKYANRLQAEDRNHRIGQDRPVTYIDIVCSGSIDERIMKSQHEKGNLVADFVQKVKKVDNITKDEFIKMIEDSTLVPI